MREVWNASDTIAEHEVVGLKVRRTSTTNDVAPSSSDHRAEGLRHSASDPVAVQLDVQQARLAASFNSLLDPYIILKAVRNRRGTIIDFEYTDANDAAVAYNETTREQLIGSRLVGLLPAHADSGLLTMYAHTFETGEPLVIDDHVFYNEIVGSERHYAMKAVKLQDSLGLSWRDITEKIEKLEQYRLLAENASDVVYYTGADFLTRYVSPSVKDLLGFEPDDIIGHSLIDFCHPDDLSVLSQAAEARNPGERSVSEIRVRTATGDYRWISAWTRAMYDDDGVISGYVGSIRDAEQERGVHEALVASEAGYRMLAENATDVIYSIDADNVIQWMSPSTRRVLGWDDDELIGQPGLTLIAPDDVDKVRALAGVDEPPAIEVRYRHKRGGLRWMSRETHIVRDDAGVVVAKVVGLHGIDAEIQNREQLAKSETLYRLLAENASDVIFQVDVHGLITWVSPSIEPILGWSASDVLGLEETLLVVDEDQATAKKWRSIAVWGDHVQPHEIRYRTSRGDVVWMSVEARPVRDHEDTVTSVVVSLRSAEIEVRSRRALTALSAGSRALVRATDESSLLDEMCRIIVEIAGYRFAWYGRRVDDEARSIVEVAASDEHRTYLDEIEVSWGEHPSGMGPTGQIIRTGLTVVTEDLQSEVRFAPWREAAIRHGFRATIGLPVRVDGEVEGVFGVYAAEPGAFDDAAVSLLEDLASEIGFGLQRQREYRLLVESLADRNLLTSAIDQASEAIVVCDPNAEVVYANPATVRTSGYALHELIGAKPSIFKSGMHASSYFENMWTILTGGNSWHGVLVNRRKDGELYEEDTTISPIHESDGTLIAYVAVKRDLTVQRALEADLVREQRDREAIVEVMREVRPVGNVHATAGLFCDAATRLADVDAACVLLINDEGKLVPVAVSGTGTLEVDSNMAAIDGDPGLLASLVDGPIQMDFDESLWPNNPDAVSIAVDEGLVNLVLASISFRGVPIGLLALGSKDPEAAKSASSRFATFEELGSYAGVLFGDEANAYLRRSVSKAVVRDIIDEARFRPVFQPFINLSSGDVVGYEALTRFDDGTAPDVRIAEAHRLGLGTELECACAKLALAEAATLSSNHFLSLNFSPAALLDGSAAAVLATSALPIVIEVTEHARIENYAAVRKAVDDIKGSRLAVDDAGAGFTSLNHILELRPDFVKLDITLVRGIDTNPARQAMAAGMCHYAKQSGTVIIAEGIETPAEAETLRQLGVTLGERGLLGQGYYFAHPGPLSTETEATSE